MAQPAIEIRNLSKMYRIGSSAPHSDIRDVIVATATWPWRQAQKMLTGSNGRAARCQDNDLWALKNVSFNVDHGQVIGIIGRNGAGKSTLLKILSRITDPTEGDVIIRGRIGSLLEVGTGFHPELTGRENIFLNGTILGMTRREIRDKFEEIVAFSEIERFIDTPVKRYSSGMYVRLAFAVAAHLEPEILIVDEVLAVGDLAFQEKCIGKMQDVAGHGRTVLFVSHNMSAVRTLCQSVCWLKDGQLMVQAPAAEGVQQYLEDGREESSHVAQFDKPEEARLWMQSAKIVCGGREDHHLYYGEDLTLEVAFASQKPITTPRLGWIISDVENQGVLNANNRFQSSQPFAKPVTRGIVRCHLGPVPLMSNRYRISLWLGDEQGDSHEQKNCLTFQVVGRDIWNTGTMPPAKASSCWWSTRFEMASES